MNILSDQESAKLVMALAVGNGRFTEAQAGTVLEWANRVKIEHTTLQLALQGLVKISFTPEGEMAFTPTEEGKNVYECVSGGNGDRRG